MVWSGMGWCLEGLLEALEPRQSCCNLVFSRKLWHLQLEVEQNNTFKQIRLFNNQCCRV